MKLSRRIQSVPPSATIAITSRAKQLQAEGVDVVSFGAGEPDFDTPTFIKDAATAALRDGDTKYVPRAAKALTEAIARKLGEENHVNVQPSQVVMTVGGKHACAAILQVLLDEDDGVLIPTPYWVSYPEMVKLAGGRPIFLEATAEAGFKITPKHILAAADQAKVLILNSPGNPTGVTYTPKELSALAEAVAQTDLIVLSDEIYEKLIYGDTQFVSFASLPAAPEDRVITVNGLSKAFAMTGWRLGWIAGPQDLIDAVRILLSHQTTNPVSFAQAGALAAYVDPQAAGVIEQMRLAFEQRGRHMHRRLGNLPSVTCVEPTGAFYCFPDISAHFGRTLGGVDVTDSLSFAKAALESVGVALVPGAPFGCDRCVRLSFATSIEKIDAGLDRLAELLA